MDGFKSMLSLIFVSTIVTLSFNIDSSLVGVINEKGALALSGDTVPQLWYGGPHLEQSDVAMSDQQITEIVSLSSTSGSTFYDYSGSRGISVQQNVTQQNVCSSNTAYCYNEVDNDFNVNPP